MGTREEAADAHAEAVREAIEAIREGGSFVLLVHRPEQDGFAAISGVNGIADAVQLARAAADTAGYLLGAALDLPGGEELRRDKITFDPRDRG